jgi:hypothetical protein
VVRPRKIRERTLLTACVSINIANTHETLCPSSESLTAFSIRCDFTALSTNSGVALWPYDTPCVDARVAASNPFEGRARWHLGRGARAACPTGGVPAADFATSRMARTPPGLRAKWISSRAKAAALVVVEKSVVPAGLDELGHHDRARAPPSPPPHRCAAAPLACSKSLGRAAIRATSCDQANTSEMGAGIPSKPLAPTRSPFHRANGPPKKSCPRGRWRTAWHPASSPAVSRGSTVSLPSSPGELHHRGAPGYALSSRVPPWLSRLNERAAVRHAQIGPEPTSEPAH